MLFIALASALALPYFRREVPQEHSHDLILDVVRPAIQGSGTVFAKLDPVFGTLADKAGQDALASNGITGADANIDCLHQNLADACIKGAKGDKNIIIACVQFAALERNTAKIGQESKICNEKPKSAELANIKQHQDPASQAAKDGHNRLVEIEVAKAAKALGFSDQEAVNFAQRTSTFEASGDDPSGRGNTCDFDPGNPVNQSPIIATKDGTVFGLAVKKGQKVDCSIVATLEGNKSKLVPAATEQEILDALSNSLPAPEQPKQEQKQEQPKQEQKQEQPKQEQKQENTGEKLPQCKGNLDGTLCTSSGSFAVGKKEDIVNLCNSCASKGKSKGVNVDGKLKDCLAKVDGGDRNPVMPLNTFGRDICQ